METTSVPDISNILSKIENADNVSLSEEINTKKHSKSAKANVQSKEPIKKPEHDIPRGKPKSGRIWKTSKERFATVKKSVKGKPIKKHLAYREEIKQIKNLSRSIKEERKIQNEEKKQRSEENKRRRLENERKSEIVQIIKNPAKLKRMRKKQLRQIEKRDLDKIKVV
ncbi:coiled-coil domain-containing protein 86 [Toxorhynchites rutilus septentrionalis]|uniref:coiled-coil domain-containing protein 86 n=1 Tax=Toxorhynchites rutilus septentrionalis TaxID=329112 RepID=UPI002479B701|nr:coiled-coil domain-containing protein 86 [Toxorhynchites rutilus septentrionalis]